ncbi:hypothetical protein WJX75_008262 [Coccomyxa subellipsoidea]|uniref:Uncharacterized protein n=1 Tax=Coccomyxa subellipsoidea TaxID=248742 RepID=A0ABR2Z4Q4_9CHLO
MTANIRRTAALSPTERAAPTDHGATYFLGQLQQFPSGKPPVQATMMQNSREEVENAVSVPETHPIAAWVRRQAADLARLEPESDRIAWPDFIKPTPNPTLLGAEEFALGGSKALFWDPVALWGAGTAGEACTTCVTCKKGKGQRDGPGKIRKVCGLTDTYFVVAPKYRHKQCTSAGIVKGGGRGASTWTALHPTVVAQWFTHTTSLLEVRSGLEKLTERYKDEAIQGPEYVWVDNSDQSANILMEIFPTVKAVLEDSTHLMRRYIRTLTPGHPLNQEFVNGLSKAFFTLHEPDRQALRASLLKGKKLTEQEVCQLPYRYWKERCRGIIPAAEDIVPALDLMMQKKWVDETGVSLITDTTADAHRAALRIIKSGKLSDPLPVEHMYYNRSKDPLKPDWITDQLAAKAAEGDGRAAVEQELSEEEERLLAADTLDALRFLDDSPTEPTSRRLRSNAAGPSQLEECGPSSIPAAPPARSGQPRKRELPGSMQHGNPQPPKPARPQPDVDTIDRHSTSCCDPDRGSLGADAARCKQSSNRCSSCSSG